VAGKKNTKVKWAIGGVEPADLPDFKSNDDIVKANKGALPPKGRTRVLVKKVTSKPNRNDDQMLTVTCEIAEGTAKKPGKFDGYTMWERLNVTEQGAPYLKRFLTAIGVKWNDFIKNTVADDSDERFTTITKIGKVNLTKPVEAWVSVRHGTDQNDDEVAEVGRFLAPPEDEDIDEDDDDTDDDEDDDDVEVDDSDDDEDDEDDDDSDEEDDEEDAAEELRAELKSKTVVALRKRAVRAGLDDDDIPSKKADIIEAIIEAELGDEDEDDEEEDEDEDEVTEEELRAALKGEDLNTLRNRARANGRKASDLKGAKKAALISMIVQDEIPPF